MTRKGFTLVEAVVATSIAAVALVALLLVRQNCLKQTSRAVELKAAATTAQKIINDWRTSDPSRQEEIQLNGAIEELGLLWISEVEDIEIAPDIWTQSLTVKFFARSHGDKEPIASFAGLRYPQDPMEELAYE